MAVTQLSKSLPGSDIRGWLDAACIIDFPGNRYFGRSSNAKLCLWWNSAWNYESDLAMSEISLEVSSLHCFGYSLHYKAFKFSVVMPQSLHAQTNLIDVPMTVIKILL